MRILMIYIRMYIEINTTIHIIEQLERKLLMLKIIYIDFDKKANNKDPKFQVGDHVRRI